MARLFVVTQKSLASAKAEVAKVSAELTAFASVMKENQIDEMVIDGGTKFKRGMNEVRGWVENIDVALLRHKRRGKAE